jgi:predicted dehydrogenase
VSDRSELKIGVIGLGIGRFHASCFAALPGVRIVAVADRGGRRLPGPLAEFAAHYGARPYALGEEMLAEETLDAVSICSPPASHRALVERAAARGMQVLLEKPMAWSLDDCDAMIAACAKAKVKLHLNFPMRQLAVVKALRRLLGAGDLGKPALASADYVMGPRPLGHWVWSHPAGPIGENTCHFIDLLVYLLGPVVQVSALSANALGPGAPAADCAALTLRFHSGALANLAGGAIASTELGVSPRLSLYGTAGQAAADGLHHTLTHLRWATRGGSVQTLDSGLTPAPPSALGPFDRYPLLEGGLIAFVESLRSGGLPFATGEEGRAVVEICDAALRSAAEAGRPQRLRSNAAPLAGL